MELLGVEGDDAAQGLAHHVQARDRVDAAEHPLHFLFLQRKEMHLPFLQEPDCVDDVPGGVDVAVHAEVDHGGPGGGDDASRSKIYISYSLQS